MNFEDLCLDPYQSNFDSGRREGTAAGLKAGYDEGRKLGHQKGLEVGIELGYMRGVAKTLQDEMLPTMKCGEEESSDAQRRVKKIEKSFNELISAIDQFPSPDEIFHSANSRLDEDTTSNDEAERQFHDDSEVTYNKEKTGAVDITSEMQRIRAKFKLLTVQLKIQELSLTKVMEEAAATAASKSSSAEEDYTKEEVSALGNRTVPEPKGDQDW